MSGAVCQIEVSTQLFQMLYPEEHCHMQSKTICNGKICHLMQNGRVHTYAWTYTDSCTHMLIRLYLCYTSDHYLISFIKLLVLLCMRMLIYI